MVKKQDFIKFCMSGYNSRGDVDSFNYSAATLANSLESTTAIILGSGSLHMPSTDEITKQFNNIINNKKILSVFCEQNHLCLLTEEVVLKDGKNLGRFFIKLCAYSVSIVEEFAKNYNSHPHVFNGRILHPRLSKSLVELFANYKYDTIVDLCTQTLFNPDDEYVKCFNKQNIKLKKGRNHVHYENNLDQAKIMFSNLFAMALHCYKFPNYKQYVQSGMQSLAETQEQIKELITYFANKPDDTLTSNMLSMDYDKIVANDNVYDIKIVNNVLLIKTKRLSITHLGQKYNLGWMQISIDLGDDDGLPHFTVLITRANGKCNDGSSFYNTAGYQHPHVGITGNPCFGNIVTIIKDLAFRRKMSALVDVIFQYLKAYNETGAYIRIENWPRWRTNDEKQN